MTDKSLNPLSDPSDDENLNEVTQDLDGQDGSEGLSPNEGGEDELDEKTKVGFQRLVARKDEELRKLQGQVEKTNQELAKREKLERDAKLNEMSEAEKWKTLARENAEKAAKAELKAFVTAELTKRNLSGHVIAEIALDSPWSIPAVKRNLASEPTWDDTVEAVKAHLPSYLDSLVVSGVKEPETQVASTSELKPDEIPEMESERSAPAKTKKRIWTRSEIRELGKDSVQYQKYQDEISLALSEGRVIEG